MIALMAAALLADPVSLTVEAPEGPLRPGEESKAHLTLSVEAPWYIYAPTGVNEPQGMTETAVEMRPSEQAQFKPAVFPDAEARGNFETFSGHKITIEQPFRIRAGTPSGGAVVRGDVVYQACKEDLCLPPKSVGFSLTLEIER